MNATYVNGIMFLNSEDYSQAKMLEYSDAIKMCEHYGYTFKTSAYRRGYIKRNKSRKAINALVVPYRGRYGVGYVLHTEDVSTAYHKVYYYTEKI